MASKTVYRMTKDRSIALIRGTTGPAIDPYSYQELEYRDKKRKVIIHRGLGSYIRVCPSRKGSSAKTIYYSPYEKTRRFSKMAKQLFPNERMGLSSSERAQIVNTLMNIDYCKYTGYSEFDWLRFLRKIEKRRQEEANYCPKTANHCHVLKSCGGYAGEPITQCLECGYVFEYEGDIMAYIA